jgi:hypothetical protein
MERRVILFLMLLLIPAASAVWFDSYHTLSLSLDHVLEKVEFVDYGYRSDGGDFSQEDGSYQIQLLDSSYNLLYETQFVTSNIIYLDPPRDCVENCESSLLTLNHTTELLYIPSFDNEMYIRILKDNNVKLEIDLDNLPLDFIDVEDQNKFNSWLIIIPLIVIVLIVLLVILWRRRQ